MDFKWILMVFSGFQWVKSFQEFIPLALQIIQGMYAKKRLEQHLSDVDLQAEELLVHGMSREDPTVHWSSYRSHRCMMKRQYVYI